MRIHLQNPDNDPLFDFSSAMWEAAAARSPDIGAEHEISLGRSADDFAAAMHETEALITDVSVIKARFPCPAPRLKLIFLTNAGLDMLAPFTWLPPDVVLLNNRGTHAIKSGEFGIMSILMLANRVPAMVTNQRKGDWRKLWGSVLGGRPLTIVGLGSLGGAIAEQAARFGMRVTGVRSNPAPCPSCTTVISPDALDAVLPHTEFLTLACPLTATTRGLIDRRRLQSLPAGAGVVKSGAANCSIRMHCATCLTLATCLARCWMFSRRSRSHPITVCGPPQTWSSAHTLRPTIPRPTIRAVWTSFWTTCVPGVTDRRCQTTSTSHAAIRP